MVSDEDYIELTKRHSALRDALREIRKLVEKRQLPITNQVFEAADSALLADVA